MNNDNDARTQPVCETLHPEHGAEEPLASELLSSLTQQRLARLLLVTFIGTHFVLPVKIAQAQSAGPQAKANTISPALATATATKDGHELHADGVLCRKCRISPKALDLSRPPTEDELRQAGQMNGPLSPLFSADVSELQERYNKELRNQGIAAGLQAEAHPLTVAAREIKRRRDNVKRLGDMNWDFGRAMQQWNTGKFRQAQNSFTKYLKDYPESPWAAEAMIHLGMVVKNDGDATQAGQLFQFVRDNTTEDAADPTWDVHQKAKLQLASLDLATGNYGSASQKLKDIIGNDTDWRRRTYATSWLVSLGHYQSNIRLLRACGSKALGFVFAGLGKDEAAQKLEELQPSRDEGFNLAEMTTLAKRYGAPMRGFRSTPAGLASLPMPLILHYDYERNQEPVVQGQHATDHADYQESLISLPTQVSWRRLSAQQRHRQGDEDCCGVPKVTTKLTAAKPNNKPVFTNASAKKSGTAKVRLTQAASAPLQLPAQAQVVSGQEISPGHEASSKENVGHFIVVRSVQANESLANVFDPQTKRAYTITFDQLSREWSGTGLVLDKPAVKQAVQAQERQAKAPTKKAVGVRVAWLSTQEMRTIVGGCCGAPCRQLMLGSQGVQMCQSNCNRPSWGVNPANLNFFMQQTPLSYQTEVGPDVNFTLSYNSYDGSNLNTPFGNRWSFGYGGYLLEGIGTECVRQVSGGRIGLILDYVPTPEDRERMERTKRGLRETSLQTADDEVGTGFDVSKVKTVQNGTAQEIAGTITLFMPDGEQQSYVPDGSGGYISEAGNYSTLTNEGTRWVLTSQTGEKFIYSIPTGTNSLIPFLTEQRDAYGNSLRFGYDSDVHLTTVTDAQGRVSRLTYDVNGKVSRIDDPFGHHAFFSYDGSGNLTQTTNMDGDTSTFGIGAYGLISQLTDSQGTWNFGTEWPSAGGGANYPAIGAAMGNNMRITITNPLGAKEEFYYYSGTASWEVLPQYGTQYGNFQGPFSWYVDANHYVPYSYIYNNWSSGYSRTVWKSRTVIEGKALITDVIRPDDTWTYTAFDAKAQPIQYRDGRGKTTFISYNNQGHVTSIKDQKNRVTTINYALNGIDATSVVNARGVTTATVTYNGVHQPTSVTDAAGRTTNLSYTGWGAPSALTNPLGETTLTNYDPLTKRVNSVVHNGALMGAYTYDEQGRVKTATDAGGTTTSYVYDGPNSLTQVSYSDGSKTEEEKGCCGVVGMSKDRQGRKTYYDYDPLKRPVRVQDASGNTVQMDYLPAGQLRQLIDAKGNITKFLYDDANRLIRKTYADGTYEAYEYDSFNGVVSYRDATGAITKSRTDETGNLAEIDYPTQSDVRFTYDELDRLKQMTDGLGTTKWSYDNLDRTTSEDGPFTNDTVRYGYDALDRIVGTSINNTDSTGYTYDGLSRLASVTSFGGTFTAAGTWTWNYNPTQVGNLDLPTQVNLPNGTKTKYAYDNLERLTGVQNVKSDGTSILSSFGYGFDNVNKKDARQSLNRQYRDGSDVLGAVQTVNFGYDPVDQLQGELSTETTPLVNIAHQYDAMGNRVQLADGPNHRRLDASFNNVNQLTSRSQYDTSTAPATLLDTTNFGYDAKGNMTGAQVVGAPSGTVYTYDEADRLTAITTTGVNKTEFFYDGLSRLRTSKYSTWNGTAWVLQNEERRIYVDMDVIQERDGTNAITATYTSVGNIGGPLARSTTSGNVFYNYDGSGNVTQLTDGTATIVANYSYDAFGNTTATGSYASQNLYRYSAKEDIGGLYYYGYRFYSPSVGRWINRDPIQENGGLNLYLMINNNPLNKMDKRGLQDVSSGWQSMQSEWNYFTDPTNWVNAIKPLWDNTFVKANDFLVDFLSGQGPTNRTEYKNMQADEFSQSLSAYEIRRQIDSVGWRTVPNPKVREWNGITTNQAFCYSVRNVWNWTQWQVGGFDWKAVRKGDVMEITIKNDADLNSFLYHAPAVVGIPSYDRHNSFPTPMGRINQVIQWDEPVPIGK